MLSTKSVPVAGQIARGIATTKNVVPRIPVRADENKRRRYGQAAVSPKPLNAAAHADTVTSWFSEFIANASIHDLSDTVIHRSKRMMLDTLGVGIIGGNTEVSRTVQGWGADLGMMRDSSDKNNGSSVVWGTNGLKATPSIAAFLNGINVHSMDFDDTWHPPTHPSGPVLPAVLALAETLKGTSYEPSTQDILVAYNVGIQIQALLLRSSNDAKGIPWRFHPPAVVGVMGSAGASARLLGLSPQKCRHALAIAASFAGAPMANAGTKTKPLHAGNSARFGLEAALLSDRGIEGNEEILDVKSGFGAFYDDYCPEKVLALRDSNPEYILHDQDIALKRFPCHLGMHWAIDATTGVRNLIEAEIGRFNVSQIDKVQILAPNSKYINRPLPTSEHEARHSFQFNVCTALLDGQVKPESFYPNHLRRPHLKNLLDKTSISTPADNIASFDEMYVEVHVTLNDGTEIQSRCETPDGHWRKPLTDDAVKAKFLSNTKAMTPHAPLEIIKVVRNMEHAAPSSELVHLLTC